MTQNEVGTTPEAHIDGGWERGCRCLACSIGQRAIEHGSAWAYGRGCRCDTCRSGNADRHHAFVQDYAARVAANPRRYKHGTQTMYTNGKCRCRACVKAKRVANAKGRTWWSGTEVVSLMPIGEGEVLKRRGGVRQFVEVVAVTPHPRVKDGRLVTIADLGGAAVRMLGAKDLVQQYRPTTAADFR